MPNASSPLRHPAPARKALIIGALGQDGSYLAERLTHNQWRVVGTARQSEPRAGLAPHLAHYSPLDLTDTAAFQRLLAAQAVGTGTEGQARHRAQPAESSWPDC